MSHPKKQWPAKNQGYQQNQGSGESGDPKLSKYHRIKNDSYITWGYSSNVNDRRGVTYYQNLKINELNNLAMCKSYSSHVKDSAMRDEDCMHEFITFLIDMAIYHRQLDKSSGLSGKIKNYRESLKNILIFVNRQSHSNNYLEKKLKDAVKSTTTTPPTTTPPTTTPSTTTTYSISKNYIVELNDPTETTTEYTDPYFRELSKMLKFSMEKSTTGRTGIFNITTSSGTSNLNGTVFFEMDLFSKDDISFNFKTNSIKGTVTCKDYNKTPLLEHFLNSFLTKPVKFVIDSTTTFFELENMTINAIMDVNTFVNKHVTQSSRFGVFDKEVKTENLLVRQAVIQIIEKVKVRFIATLCNFIMNRRVSNGNDKASDIFKGDTEIGKAWVEYVKNFPKTWCNEIYQELLNEADVIVKKYTPDVSYVKLSKNTDKIFHNVYKKWDKLTQEEKDFFNEYFTLQEYDDSMKQWVNANKQNLGNDSSKYRVNLNRDQYTKKILFAQDLESKYKNYSGFFYKDPSDRIHKIDTEYIKCESLFSEIYTTVYENHDNTPVIKLSLCGDKIAMQVRNDLRNTNEVKLFNVHLNKTLIEAVTNLSKKIPSIKDIDSAILELNQINEKWYYDNDTNSYVLYDNLNKYTKKTINQVPLIEALNKFRNKCYGTQISDDPKECKRVLFECLVRSDTEGVKVCLENLKIVNFSKVVPMEISKLHPLTVLGLLRKMKFHQYKDTDEYGRKLVKIEPVSRWAKRIFEETEYAGAGLLQYDDADFKEKFFRYVSGSINLIKYLNLLVQYVNSNPGILNKHFKAPKSVVNNISSYAESLGLARRVEPTGHSYFGNMLNINYNLQKTRMAGGSFGLYPPPMLLDARLPLFHQSHLIPKRVIPRVHIPNFTSPVSQKYKVANYYISLFDTLKKELEIKGRKISNDDNINIKEQINKIMIIENVLMNIAQLYSYYNYNVGGIADSPAAEKVYSKLVGSYEKNLNRQEAINDNLANIIADITKNIDDEDHTYVRSLLDVPKFPQ